MGFSATDPGAALPARGGVCDSRAWRNDDGPAGRGSMGDADGARESEAVRESGVCKAVEVTDVVRSLGAGDRVLHDYLYGGLGGGDTWVLS